MKHERPAGDDRVIPNDWLGIRNDPTRVHTDPRATSPSRAHLYAHQNPERYYRTDHLADHASEWIPEVPPGYEGTVLVVGCGRGESVKLWPNSKGIDVNQELLKVWAELRLIGRCVVHDARRARELGLFDVSVSADFIEHLPPDHFELVMEALVECSSYGAHVVDMTPETAFRGPNGENLHELGMTKADLLAWCEKTMVDTSIAAPAMPGREGEERKRFTRPVSYEDLGGRHVKLTWGEAPSS